MKKSLFKAAVCLFIFAMVAVTTGCKEEVFQVNDVVSDPGAFSEALTIEGIVYKIAQGDTSIVGIMDKKELQCTTPNCNKALLAIKVPGARLAIGDEVKASGNITKESWGYMLKAEEVELITKHKLGA